MEKRFWIYGCAFILLALVIWAVIDYNFFLNYFIAPMLSPFFPELAPFDASVTLNINLAPMINISKEIFVCEDKGLLYFFNVTDNEGGPLNLDISPKNPFFF